MIRSDAARETARRRGPVPRLSATAPTSDSCAASRGSAGRPATTSSWRSARCAACADRRALALGGALGDDLPDLLQAGAFQRAAGDDRRDALVGVGEKMHGIGVFRRRLLGGNDVVAIRLGDGDQVGEFQQAALDALATRRRRRPASAPAGSRSSRRPSPPTARRRPSRSGRCHSPPPRTAAWSRASAGRCHPAPGHWARAG